jgi:hypothetical protein
VGTTLSLAHLLFDDAPAYMQRHGLDGMGDKIQDLVYFPLMAFCILLFSRVISELIDATAEIARNTKK